MLSMERRWRRSAVSLAAAGSALALMLTGCSSGGSDGGGTAPAAELDTTFEYDDATVQEIINVAFGVDFPMEDVPAETYEAFARASVELTPEQVQTALDCWKQPECKIGDGELHVGIFNAVDNLWQTAAAMNVMLQAMTYPEVGTMTYAFVNDLPSAQSAVRSMVADGVDAIVSYNPFGSAMAPVFQEAQAAGTVITTYVGETPDVGGDVINNQVYAEACLAGEAMGGVLMDDMGLTGSDEIAFFFGTPGNPQDTLVTGCLEEKLADGGPSIGFQQDTDWSRPGVAAASSALISSGIPVKAVLNTYSDPIPQLIDAYDQAGEDIPAILTWTEMNELFGIWEGRLGTDREFELYYTNALINQSRLALTNAMNILAGKDVPERTPMPLPLIKAEKGIYEAELPGDFPGWSALIPEEVVIGMTK